MGSETLTRSLDARYQACARLLIACLLFAAAVANASPQDLISKPSTDFALRSLSGDNLRLSEQLGEVVILNFWATWCGPCRQEMPLLDEIHNKYRRAGLVLFSINIDEDAQAAAEMAKTLGVSYPVLLDARKEVAKAYEIGTLPVTFLIDREGKVRYVSESFKPGFEKRYTETLRELLNE